MTSQIQSGAKPDGIMAEILSPQAISGTESNTPEEEEAARYVVQLYQKSRQWKQNWAKDHERWWNLWESNHYATRKAHTLSKAIVNQVWSAVETFIGHITDDLPSPNTKARAPEFQENAKLVERWLKYVVDANNLEEELEHPVRDACVTGAGWFAVEWDEERLNKRGDVVIVPVDGRFIFPAPYARNLAECQYVIEAKNVPREFVLRWEKGELVPPGPQDLSLFNTRSYRQNKIHGDFNWAQLTTTDGTQSNWTTSQSVPGGRRSDVVTLMKCYVRQRDGAMRLVVTANGIVLQDGPSPYDDDDFPYVVVNILPTLDTIQGRGLMQFVEGLQTVLNDSLSYLLDQQRFSSDPMLIVDSVNLEDGQLIDNSPGAVLPNSNPNGQGYRWLDAPGFNQAWLQIQNIVTNHMDSVLGNVEIIRGERPVGVNTLGGLEVVRDEANVRLRKHMKWVKASLKRMYLLILSRLRQFAKDERIIRYSDRYGQDKFTAVNQATGVAPDGSLIRDITLPQEAELEITFDKEIPGGRQARIELALQLAATPAQDGMPMVDRQYVLQQAEVDEAPEIIARLASSMQAQTEAGVGPAGAAGAGAGALPAPATEGSEPMDDIAELFGGGR